MATILGPPSWIIYFMKKPRQSIKIDQKVIKINKRTPKWSYKVKLLQKSCTFSLKRRQFKILPVKKVAAVVTPNFMYQACYTKLFPDIF